MGVQGTEGQGSLIEKVIRQGLCVHCGACIGLCPYIHYFDGKVLVMDQCNSDTWRCLQICPRADYEGTSLDSQRSDLAQTGKIGTFQRIAMARATNQEIRKNAQYGGVVTALLIYALERGYVKSAVLTDRGDTCSPKGILATNRSEILNCSGSRYSASASLSALNGAIKAGEDKLGMVGLPCQMEALSRMRLLVPDGEERSRRIGLKIGLFCTWAMDYRQLDAFLKAAGVEKPIIKFDIPPPPAEKFQVQTPSGWKDFALSDLRPLIQKGCALCEDMTAERTDLSVGTVEGLEGWNTLVVRTDLGAELVNSALENGWLETEPLPSEDFEHLNEAAHNKRERGKKAGREMGSK